MHFYCNFVAWDKSLICLFIHSVLGRHLNPFCRGSSYDWHYFCFQTLILMLLLVQLNIARVFWLNIIQKERNKCNWIIDTFEGLEHSGRWTHNTPLTPSCLLPVTVHLYIFKIAHLELQSVPCEWIVNVGFNGLSCRKFYMKCIERTIMQLKRDGSIVILLLWINSVDTEIIV